MAFTNVNDLRILSPPLDFFFAGWRAKSHELAHHGWEFAIHPNEYDMTYEVAVKHDKYGLIGFGSIRRSMMEEASFHHWKKDRPVPVQIRLGKDIKFSGRDPEETFVTVNMLRPQYTKGSELFHDAGGFEFHSIREFWVPADVIPGTTKEIILDDLSMDEVLKLALIKQVPVQEKIRKRMVRDSEMNELLKKGTLPASKVEAQLRLVA